MYQILIDRFANPSQDYCTNLTGYCGGTILGIAEKFDYIQKLGVDGVILSPIVDSFPGGYHGYWPREFYKVNPLLGTEDDMRQLSMKFHKHNMKVFGEVNLNQAGYPGIEMKDLAMIKPFDTPEYYHSDNCSLLVASDFEAETLRLERCRIFGMPDFNHENPVTWLGLMSWVRDHVDSYGFDGIRIDAARHINRDFLSHIPESGSPIPAYHEVVSSDMSFVVRYATHDSDAVYNYPLYFLLRGIFVPSRDQKPMSELVDWMAENAQKTDGHLMLNFLDNNDLPRFVYLVSQNRTLPSADAVALYHNAVICLLGQEGVPILLFGSEQAVIAAPDSFAHTAAADWHQPLWHTGYHPFTETFQMIQKTLWLRRHMHGMHEYRMSTWYSDHELLVFARGDAVFVVRNSAHTAEDPAQRVLHFKNTFEEGWDQLPCVICNLLADYPSSDCMELSSGKTIRLHVFSKPKLYVSRKIIGEYEAQQNPIT